MQSPDGLGPLAAQPGLLPALADALAAEEGEPGQRSDARRRAALLLGVFACHDSCSQEAMLQARAAGAQLGCILRV